MWNSLRVRLTIIFIGLAVGPLILVGAILIQRSFALEREQALDLQGQVARRVSAEVGAFLGEIENNLYLLGGEVRSLEQPDRAQYLSLLLRTFNSGTYRDVFEELTLLDDRGQEQFRISRQEIVASDELVDRSGAAEFEQPKASGETYFSPVRFDEATGQALMTIAIPLSKQRSVQLSGVLVADLRLKTVGELIADLLQVGEGQTIYVVDPAGRVVAHQDPSVELQDAHIALPEQAGIQPGLDGTDVVLAVNKIKLGEQVLTIAAEKPASVALEQAVSTAFTIAVTVVGALVIAGSLGFLVVRQIVRPIEALATTAQAISTGDLSQRVAVTSRDELGALANAFNTMATQFRHSFEVLEDRVRERTRALETSMEISRQTTAILDLNELLQLVVNRIQTEFNFYHTHIYLVDDESGDLVMAEGSGEVGQKLKEQGHRLKAGQGIVGTVASTNEHFLSNNVDEALNFVRNPLLLDTSSELAVPLRKGDRVLGVLDIQSEQVSRFTPSDVALMQSIADQVAVAIDNARLLTETQVALQEVERLNRRLTREGWEGFGEETAVRGYRFSRGIDSKVNPAPDAWLPPMQKAAASKQLVKQIHTGNGDHQQAELAVPLVLRGVVIGALGVRREESPTWNAEEIAAVEAVANQVTLALENARLSKEQEKTIVQLKEVDRLKSDFLTSMSHELRTPLNSIIGFADVLLQGIDGELNETALNDIRLIHNSGQYLLALINDILDLSKIEAGKMELVRRPVDVKETIYDVLAASSSLLKDKPVEVVVSVEEDLPLVYADKLRFNQILLNLVSNAAKFTDEGSITIKAGVWENDPHQALVSIVDTGAGIPSNMLDTVFDRFHQLDSSSRRKAGGTGLGLAICRELVELHGGTVGVASEEGVGSNFYFTIPFVQGVASADETVKATIGS